VLEELPAPRLMLTESEEGQARSVSLDPASWARLEWFAGRRRVASAERPVSGAMQLGSDRRILGARLQIDFGAQAPRAELPRGLGADSKQLELHWTPQVSALGAEVLHAQRSLLSWNRRQGELRLQLAAHKESRRSTAAKHERRADDGALTFESSRPAAISLRDYGLELSFELEGERTSLSEVRISLHLVGAADPPALPSSPSGPVFEK
jgi:hypothetical protein